MGEICQCGCGLEETDWKHGVLVGNDRSGYEVALIGDGLAVQWQWAGTRFTIKPRRDEDDQRLNEMLTHIFSTTKTMILPKK